MLPLSVRIRRGFSRIGVALGIAFAVVAGAFGALLATEQWSDINRRHDQAQCIVAWNQAQKTPPSGERQSTQAGRPSADLGIFADLVPDRTGGFQRLVASDIGCSGPMYDVNTTEAARLVSDGKQSRQMEMMTLSAGVAFGTVAGGFIIWLVCYGIGWALSGFARD